MPYLKKDTLQIINLFKKLQNLQDLSELLELEYVWVKHQLFKLKVEEKYKSFFIPKKNGESRKIDSPVGGIRLIQERINEVLKLIYEPKASVHGFVIDKNIVTNAQNHCNKNFVLNVDIEDFFFSITQKRIRGVFMSPPYNLPSKVATSISHICCYNGTLPQGAPTSPIISNIVCAKLDSQLRLLANKYKCFYTRYADDITFSTTASKFASSIAKITGSKISDVTLSDDLIYIFESNGFKINYNKVRIQRKNQKQEVTGLTVNNKINVSRKYLRQVRAMLYDWHKNGYVQAHINHLEFRRKQNKNYADFAFVLIGKIEFIGQVRQKDDLIYQKLLQSYNSLIEREILRRISIKFDDGDYIFWGNIIDEYVTSVINRYVDLENISGETIREGFDELKKLKNGQDPNYDLPGVPVAYAFQYLPRKIMAMTAVLSHYFRDENVPIPNKILDIGSGTDAVSIAFGLFLKNINLTIKAIEPCSYMRNFAKYKPNFSNLEILNTPGFLGNWFEYLDPNYYDLIVMSSILQNSFRPKSALWWEQWAQDLYTASTKTARVIVIEPCVKEGLINKMDSAMKNVGWVLKENLLLSYLFPEVVNKKLILQQLTSLKKEIVGTYWNYPVECWNTYSKYDEFIYIYKK